MSPLGNVFGSKFKTRSQGCEREALQPPSFSPASGCPVYVPTVELVVSAHIKHRAAERLISPSHTTRLGADVTGQDDKISVCRWRVEG